MEILVKLLRFGDTFLFGLFRLVNELIWEYDSYENCGRFPYLKNGTDFMQFGLVDWDLWLSKVDEQ